MRQFGKLLQRGIITALEDELSQSLQIIKSELIRLAQQFESQQAFQNVKNLAKQFKVERSASDRHRFDTFTPVNVIPGLAVVANNTQASTDGDALSI